MNKPEANKHPTDFMQLSAQVSLAEVRDSDNELARYRVQLTGAGTIERGANWSLKVPEATLRRDYGQFNKAGAYVNQMGEHVPSYLRSVQDKVGYFTAAKWNAATKTIDADMVLARTDNAEQFKAQLDLDLESNNSMVQFSAVYSFDFSEKETKRNGQAYYVVSVDRIREVFSVDAVDRGAFPMKPLAELSKWRQTFSPEEKDMAEKNDAVDPKGNGEGDVALREHYDALKKQNDEQAAAMAEQAAAMAEQNTALATLQEQVAEMNKGNAAAANERHFETKTVALADGERAKLREAIDFDNASKEDIDRVVDPLVAILTAEGREMMRPTVVVTQDQADTRVALMTAAVLGDTYKDGDKSYEATDVEGVIKQHFGEVEDAMSPHRMWRAMTKAHEEVGLTDAEVDENAETGEQVARLNATTSSSWGTTLIQVIPRVARMLHDGSELTGWLNMIIPPRSQYSVPDFNDRFLRYTGTYAQLAVVAENTEVPDVAISGSFRVPQKPEKRQGKFYLTYEQMLNSPTNAIRSLAQGIGTSVSATDYHQVMDLLLGSGHPSANAPAKSLSHESATKDGTSDWFIPSGAGQNYRVGAVGSNGFTYENALVAVGFMMAQKAYGADQFALAGQIKPMFLLVPASDWHSADAMTRAVLEPGTANNAVNRLNGLTAIPISTSSYTSGNEDKIFGVLANPADAQAIIRTRLNGQPPQFQPNVLRDDMAKYNRITYKASHIRRFTLVDKRAIAVLQVT